MNGIFKVNGNNIKIITLNDCTCGQLEDAENDIENMLEDLFEETEVTREELNGKLIYIDGEMDELMLMNEWEGDEFNNCGVFYAEKIYDLKCFQ